MSRSHDAADAPVIRRLTPSDLSLAHWVVVHFYGAEADFHALQTWLESPSNCLLAATVGEELAGFLLAYRLEKPGGVSAMLWVAELEVIPAFRRRGVGRALIDAARELAGDQNLSSVELLTNHSNTAAVAFYRETGGEVVHGDDLLISYRPT